MANPLKQMLLGTDRQLIAGWTMFASPLVAEAMAWAGYDFIVIDAEHSPLTQMGAVHSMQAVASTGSFALLRLADQSETGIKHIMDCGAKSLMIPMVETGAQAEALVKATRYAPEGHRGFAFMHRASRFGTDSTYLETANDEVLLIAQIETPQAMEQLEDIAGTEGIDAIFIGPGDMSAAMGLLGQVSGDEVMRVMEDAARRAKALGVKIGGLAANPAMAKRLLAMGYDFVPVGNDIALLSRAAKAALEEVRGSE
jgi:2-keto-3-deoxy-L-rhamnonate aldolase RhmA